VKHSVLGDRFSGNDNRPTFFRRETMTTRQKDNLVQTKLNLAAKYRRLATTAKSKPKQSTFIYQAERYRRQAQKLSGK
jgi:hypothetical protein